LRVNAQTLYLDKQKTPQICKTLVASRTKMSTPKKIFKWFGIGFATLIVIETITYFSFAEKQLKNKILPTSFNKYHSDSAYVRDFFFAECAVGDNNTNHDMNLKPYVDKIKKKLNVRSVTFANKETYSFNDSITTKNKIVYWVHSTTFGLRFPFYCSLNESLSYKKSGVIRQTNYMWCLFCWVQTFEFLQTD
jgi:hypothetical protein